MSTITPLRDAFLQSTLSCLNNDVTSVKNMSVNGEITLPTAPSAWNKAANKQYVDDGDAISMSHGEISQNDTAATTALTNQNTWYPVLTTWTASGYENNVTATVASGTLTPTTAGKYLVIWRCAFSIDGTNQQMEGGVLLNGAEVLAGTDENMFATTGTTYRVSGQCIVDMNGTTDYLQIGLNNNTSAGKTATIDHAGLTIQRIGD